MTCRHRDTVAAERARVSMISCFGVSSRQPRRIVRPLIDLQQRLRWRPAGSERPYSKLQAVRCVFQAVPGYGHGGETGASISNRNRIMTGLRFLFRVTLRQLDLAAEIYHIREPQKIPLVMSQDETRRLLAVATSLKVRVLLSLAYGCGLRASDAIDLKLFQ
jgi:integrase